jgi:type I restriction enzyme S subunit
MSSVPDNKSLRPGWKVWRFDQMATNVNVRIDNPSESGMEHYVGLEHLDPDSLKIRRWGAPEDVEATKLMFKKGDIIFGRRRAYQRKLGVAEFDGICSAHAMVLRAMPDVVVPEFLPFFMQSELFMSRAVEISVGSLSPTINWKTMAVQEFALPPISEQVRVIRALQAAADSINALQDAEKAASELLQAVVDAGSSEPDASETSLQDLCELPITYGIVQAGPHIDSGVPYIRVSDMTSGEQLSLHGMLRTAPEIAERFKRSSVSRGDIVFALRGAVGLCRVVPDELHGANLTQGTARISIADGAVRTFVYWALRSTSVRRQIDRASKGSTFKEITLASLRDIKLRVPSAEPRSTFNARVAELAAGQTAIRARTLDARLMFARVRNSALGA